MADNTHIILASNRNLKGFEKENESSWNKPFCFIQAADTQFGMIATYLEGKVNSVWDEEIELTKKAIEAVNRIEPRPRFFIVCGDLIDAMPGNKFQSPQREDFLKVFAQLHPDIPLVCVCGNHDIGNTPTEKSIQSYCDKFGDDYFTFFCGGVMFIVLNSQFFEDASLVQDLAKAQDSWLEEQLFEAKMGNYKHVVIFQHIPWFLKEPLEENEYFNIDVDLRLKMLKRFKDANVKAIFCGHYHRNSGGFYENMELVVTSAIGAQLGTDQSGFRIVKVLENNIIHNYYTSENVPATVKFDL